MDDETRRMLEETQRRLMMLLPDAFRTLLDIEKRTDSDRENKQVRNLIEEAKRRSGIPEASDEELLEWADDLAQKLEDGRIGIRLEEVYRLK